MTDAEWAVSEDPRKMWAWVTRTDPSGSGEAGLRRWEGKPSDRKGRLFAVALSRLLGPELGGLDYGGWQAALANAEGMAAGRPTFRTPGQFWVDNPVTPRAVSFGLAALSWGQRLAAAALLRNLLGNPWRETPREPCVCCAGRLPAWAGGDRCPRCRGRGWHFPRRLLTPDVLSLAKAACEFRVEGGWLDPARLALLGDGLEDAGAVAVSPAGEPPHPEEALLRHLRGFAPCRDCMLPTPETAGYGGGVYWCPGCGGTEGGNPDAYWQRLPGRHALGCWALDAVNDLW